jgi:putative membrane protein
MMGGRGHGMSDNAHMGWGNHMNWGWGGGLMMILWVVVIAALVYWFVQSTQKNRAVAGGQESALDILKKRYARGELSKQEYEERKRDLQ